MRILVTGGAGFIGSNFVHAITNENCDVNFSDIIILDKLSYAANLQSLKLLENDSRITFIKGDIQDSLLIKTLLGRVDLVVNFAAESHVDRSIDSSMPFIQSNVVGLTSLLENLRIFPNVKFIQISTDEVYGSVDFGSSKEEDLLKPNSPYSSSKASGDMICRAYFETYDLDIMLTRCTNNYGSYQHPEKFIPRAITNLLTGRNIPIYGSGLNVRDWIHVSDHIDCILSVIKLGKPGAIYNIGSDQLRTNIQVAHSILQILGMPDSRIEFVADRLGHDMRYSLDFAKASSQLDYHPKVSFEYGLASTVSWYEKNRDWWENSIAI